MVFQFLNRLKKSQCTEGEPEDFFIKDFTENVHDIIFTFQNTIEHIIHLIDVKSLQNFLKTD